MSTSYDNKICASDETKLPVDNKEEFTDRPAHRRNTPEDTKQESSAK